MKSYIWDRYQQGDAVKSIGRYFDRPTSSIHRQLAVTGGIRPPRRKRSTRCLSLAEREEVSRGLVVGLSIRAIASGLGRAPSTVSREIMRNGGVCDYRATQADQNALDRALRPKACKLALNRPLCQVVELKLRRKWSPEQIAGWLKREHPGDEWNQVSHETIYRSLFIQARGALKEVRDGLEIRHQPTGEPHQFHIALGLPLQHATGLNPVEVAVDIDFQECCRVVTWTASDLWLNAVEPHPGQVQFIHEDINDPDGVVFSDVFIESFGE